MIAEDQPLIPEDAPRGAGATPGAAGVVAWREIRDNWLRRRQDSDTAAAGTAKAAEADAPPAH